jgi:O-antigen biosynthesis protein
VPWAAESSLIYEHFHRYLWAADLVAGQRVLDLGCGEGFGSVLLAGTARDVTGVDIDERAVEHARLNYQRGNLSFATASALDLSGLQPGAFDAVVAFEMIEHVNDHERLLDEVGRVLDEDGILVVSTPDKELYSAEAGQVNEFHDHELTLAEFSSLLASRFEHVALWGQRTISGSLMSSLDGPARGAGAGASASTFWVRPAGEEWEVCEEPPPLFAVAVASHRPLPAAGWTSTLADITLELRREPERAGDAEVARRDALLADANAQLAEKREQALALGERLQRVEDELLGSGDRMWSLELELDAERVKADEERRFRLRTEESVAWQTFQRARRAVYRVLGEDTRASRALGATLRRAGRALKLGDPGD